MPPRVVECAAIGVPDAKSGEAVKVFVVRKDPTLTEATLMDFCKENLTGYKKPKYIVFRDELPKTNVGRSCGANCVDGGAGGAAEVRVKSGCNRCAGRPDLRSRTGGTG